MARDPRKVGLGVLTGAALVAIRLLIVPSEGEVHHAYLDPPGVPTICVGHTEGVRMGQKASHAQCTLMLDQDVIAEDRQLDGLIRVPQSKYRRASWISFAFNVGVGGFARSKALREINAGHGEEACREMAKWVCTAVPAGRGDRSGRCRTNEFNKAVDDGLVNRREREMAVCLKN